MAEGLFDTQGTPSNPGSGKGIFYFDSVTKKLTFIDDTGRKYTVGGAIRNWNTADVVANAAETYLAGSALAVPPHGLQIGATMKWRLFMTKTAAGTATPIWRVRIGINGTTADAQVLIFTGPAQTAVVDTGFVEVTAVLRSVGAAGSLAGGLILNHNLATTGFANIGSPTLQNTNTFDTTVANLIIGLTVNPGTAGVWTHQVVKAELLNI